MSSEPVLIDGPDQVQISAQQQEQEQEKKVTTCTQCQRTVPTANLDLHLLKCKGQSSSPAQPVPASSVSVVLSEEEARTLTAVFRTVNNVQVQDTSSRAHLVRGKISSAFSDLDELSQLYPFIPSSLLCRPRPEQIERKAALMYEIDREWRSLNDYILCTVFNCEQQTGADDKKQVDRRQAAGKRAFLENSFPYQIRGHHYVMWYAHNQAVQITDTIIGDHIQAEIEALVGPDMKETFQFGWYENPKMTVPGVFHVQVFWAER